MAKHNESLNSELTDGTLHNIGKITAIIEEKKQEKEKLIIQKPILNSSRSDTLAKIALGEATSGDLKKIDKINEQMKEQLENLDKSIKEIDITMLGLEARLESERKKLAEDCLPLERDRLAEIINKKANDISKEYLNAIENVFDCYHRLMAYGSLLKYLNCKSIRIDGKKINEIYTPASGAEIKIPMFLTDVFASHIQKNHFGFLSSNLYKSKYDSDTASDNPSIDEEIRRKYKNLDSLIAEKQS